MKDIKFYILPDDDAVVVMAQSTINPDICTSISMSADQWSETSRSDIAVSLLCDTLAISLERKVRA